jgi:hypothetical protein
MLSVMKTENGHYSYLMAVPGNVLLMKEANQLMQERWYLI